MEHRIRASGIQTAEELCHASRETLHQAWGSHLGDRLWFMLRGQEMIASFVKKPPQSIGHSHVLPPLLRAPVKAYSVLCKLLHKASERLRTLEMRAGKLKIGITYLHQERWSSEIHFKETNITLYLVKALSKLWKDRPHQGCTILKLEVTLLKLQECFNYTPDLFASLAVEEKYQRLDIAVDTLRARFGNQSLYLGSEQEGKDSASVRISFTHIPNSPQGNVDNDS